jgi:acyl carrier protein
MVSETPARPVGADEVFRIIRERLADILEIEESRVTLEASFADDLSADSLALIELVEAIEQELADRAEGFRIEDEDLAELRTVRDAVDYIVERVG